MYWCTFGHNTTHNTGCIKNCNPYKLDEVWNSHDSAVIDTYLKKRKTIEYNNTYKLLDTAN